MWEMFFCIRIENLATGASLSRVWWVVDPRLGLANIWADNSYEYFVTNPKLCQIFCLPGANFYSQSTSVGFKYSGSPEMMTRPSLTNTTNHIPSPKSWYVYMYSEFNSFYVILIVLQVTSKHATGSNHAKSTWTHAKERVNVYNKKTKKIQKYIKISVSSSPLLPRPSCV